MNMTAGEAEKERDLLLRNYVHNDDYTGFEPQADGVNHIALIVRDLEETVKFYAEVVGLKLLRVRTMDGDPASTQVFFDMGRGELLAFLRLKDKTEDNRMGIGGLHHFALTVTREQYAAFKERLDERGLEYNSISHEILDSISTIDPNGVEVELSVWNIDPEEMSQQ